MILSNCDSISWFSRKNVYRLSLVFLSVCLWHKDLLILSNCLGFPGRIYISIDYVHNIDLP